MPPLLLVLALVLAALVAAPLLAVAWQALEGSGGGTLAHLWSTVLPDYVRTTLYLCLGVGTGVAVLGTSTAWLCTRYDFPLRASLEWALVLPLAMPSYVLAYTYTDLLQFVGPVQTALREWLGWRYGDYWFPEIRSVGGAILMFSLVLYPYVYLLTRTAFLERAHGLMEVARTLGLGPHAVFWRVCLPMARPALAAGVALALMETLADYGTVSYFGLQSFTTGIYRAWFSLGDRIAAAQLSMVLLGFVLLVLLAERWSRGRARFAGAGVRQGQVARVRLRGWRAGLASACCALPLLLGFVLPAACLLLMAMSQGDAQFAARVWTLVGNSALLASSTAVLAVTLALLLAYANRIYKHAAMRTAKAVVGMGYALPGSVIAVGVLIPVTQLDHALSATLGRYFGGTQGLLLTGSIAALVYACLVRYLTAAVQSVDSGLGRITPQMESVARSLGLSPLQTLWRVHMPLLRGSALTALLLVFMDVMKELPATLVMRPFDFDTLATQVYTLAADERLAEASTAALAIVGVGLLPMILLCAQIARNRPTSAAC